MRPGGPEDMPALVRLMAKEAQEGRRETPPGRWIERMLTHVDWETSSRVVADARGALEGAVVVTHRSYDIGVITRVEVAVASAEETALLRRLVEWGVAFSRAAGAAGAQVWLPAGARLTGLGLEKVRRWWRMDRPLDGLLPGAAPVPGYSERVGAEVHAGVWSEVHNDSFADHWRYSFRGEEELMAGRIPSLCLLAVDGSERPAAIVLGQIETYSADLRPQPVGIVGSVGTVRRHRRRGLARWLVCELLPRLREAGASSATLYVDAMNPTGAPALYRSLGFGVAFETEVWEAVFP